MTAAAIEEWISARVGQLLNIPKEEVDRTMPFPSLGLDSLTLFSLTGELAELLGRDLAAPLTWEFSTIADLAGHLGTRAHDPDDLPIFRVMRDLPLALSFAQERTWRAANKEADGNLIVEQWILEGDLDAGVLEQAILEVVRRQEILRTTYSVLDGQPVQTIHPPAFTLRVVDISGESNPEQKALELLREDRRHLFNLEEGPLFLGNLYRLAKTQYRLVFRLHHLLYDAASLEIFYEELSAIYAAFCEGKQSPLPDLEIQVADFATWQREWLRKGSSPYQKRMAWWKKYWDGPMADPPALPFRWKEKPETPDVEKSVVTWELPTALAEKIRELCRREGATYYIAFFAAFEILLREITGQDEVVIGTYVSDRNRSEVKRTMGFLVNLLALRGKIAGQSTFLEAVREARSTIQQATLHMELPFDEFAGALRDEGRPVPNVQVIFLFVTDAELALQLAGVKTTRWRVKFREQMPWGLSMHVFERGDGRIRARISFDAGIYDPAGAEWMMRRYEDVLQTLTAAPDVPFDESRARAREGGTAPQS